MIAFEAEDAMMLPEPKGIAVKLICTDEYEITGAGLKRPYTVGGFYDDTLAGLYVAFCDCPKGKRDENCRHAIAALQHMVKASPAMWSELERINRETQKELNMSEAESSNVAATEEGYGCPHFFTREQTALLLGLSESEIEAFVSDSKLTRLYVSGRKQRKEVFPYNEVMAWIYTNTHHGRERRRLEQQSTPLVT